MGAQTVTEMINFAGDIIQNWAKSQNFPDTNEDIFNGLVDMVGRLARIRKNESRSNFPLPHDVEIVCSHIIVYILRYGIKNCSNLGNCVEAIMQGNFGLSDTEKEDYNIGKLPINISKNTSPTLTLEDKIHDSGGQNTSTIPQTGNDPITPSITIAPGVISTSTTGTNVPTTYIVKKIPPKKISRGKKSGRNRRSKNKR